ncbi:MAG TPA: hypothetical protein VFB68_14185 [Xanthobacteraceae bacterium]|nr:hypothetical protein [Xanthobacteraceae bacterium]
MVMIVIIIVVVVVMLVVATTAHPLVVVLTVSHDSPVCVLLIGGYDRLASIASPRSRRPG